MIRALSNPGHHRRQNHRIRTYNFQCVSTARIRHSSSPWNKYLDNYLALVWEVLSARTNEGYLFCIIFVQMQLNELPNNGSIGACILFPSVVPTVHRS